MKDRVLKINEVLEILKVSEPSLYRWIKSGLFPNQIQLGPNSVGWLESEVYEWLSTRPRSNAPNFETTSVSE